MYFWWEVNFIFKYLIKFQSVRYFRKHICHIWASTSASFITCVSQANRYHDVLQRSLCLSDFQISHKSKICKILQWKSATFTSFNFLSPSYRHHDVPQRSVRWQHRPGGWGHRGQRGEAMMARHWALCWWQKTLTGSTPRGGRGSKSSKMKFCKMIPWCSEGTLFWRLCLEKFKISHCSWNTTPDPKYLTLAEFMRYFTKTTISHGCRFREI